MGCGILLGGGYKARPNPHLWSELMIINNWGTRSKMEHLQIWFVWDVAWTDLGFDEMIGSE